VIALTRKPRTVPAVYAAGEGIVPAGSVYVQEGDQRLRNGERVVLETSAGRLELTSLGSVQGGIERDGTYLDASDLAAVSPPTSPTLRRYTFGDTLGQMRSRQGLLLLSTTALGAVVAALAVWFALAGEDPTSAATVAGRARVAVEWVAEPAGGLDSASTPADVAAARVRMLARERAAASCLDRLAGREGPKATVPGVECEASDPPWYRSNDAATWVTLAAGLLTALFSVLGLADRFGFRKSPA
jgi:hypothetical protein